MIYFDSLMSGYTVRGNRIEGARSGMLVHGGRDTTIVANTFSDVDIAVVLDDGGPDGGWPHEVCPKAMDRGLQYVNATAPPWRTAFPQAAEAGVPSKLQCRCVNTKIQHNTCGAGVGQLVVLSDPAMLNVSSYKAALAPNINCPTGDRSLKTDERVPLPNGEHVARHGPVHPVFSSEELG